MEKLIQKLCVQINELAKTVNEIGQIVCEDAAPGTSDTEEKPAKKSAAKKPAAKKEKPAAKKAAVPTDLDIRTLFTEKAKALGDGSRELIKETLKTVGKVDEVSELPETEIRIAVYKAVKALTKEDLAPKAEETDEW